MRRGSSVFELLVTVAVVGVVAITLGPVWRDLAREERSLSREIASGHALDIVSARLRRDALEAQRVDWESATELRLQAGSRTIRWVLKVKKVERVEDPGDARPAQRRSWNAALAPLQEASPPGTFALRAESGEVLVFATRGSPR